MARHSQELAAQLWDRFGLSGAARPVLVMRLSVVEDRPEPTPRRPVVLDLVDTSEAAAMESAGR
jgi:hypothetical protein